MGAFGGPERRWRLATQPKPAPRSPQRRLHKATVQTTTDRARRGRVGKSYDGNDGHQRKVPCSEAVYLVDAFDF